MKRVGLVLAAFLGLAATAVPASADLYFTLDNGGGIASTPGTYGTVQLHQNGSGIAGDVNNIVTVTVTLAAGELFVNSGAGSGFVWNITNNPSLSTPVITSGNAAKFDTSGSYATGQLFKATPFTGGNCGNSNGNCFEYSIGYTGNGASQATENTLKFDVTKTNGLLITEFNNANGYYFAADVGLNCTVTTGVDKKGNPTSNTNCGATGNIGTATPGVVPEPGTLSMSVAGLAGLTALTMLRRRRKPARA